MKRFPTLSQWKQLFKVLTEKEKKILTLSAAITAVSCAVFVGTVYFSNTVAAPADGGIFVEGVVGQPRFINPLYGETNDIDRALLELTFSGLMTYDAQGNIVNDIAKNYTVSDDGKTYEINLKENVFWHDGRQLTADDVVFTIRTAQNPDYKSPLRANWIDVNVQKTSPLSLRFILKSPYNSFLENLTVKIIPQHIWQNISPENFIFSSYNLQPIGSGPFSFGSIEQGGNGFIKSISLQSNRRYHSRPPYVSKIIFQFFEKKDDLAKAANAHAVNGFTLSAFDNNEVLAQKQIRQGWISSQKFSSHSFVLPRYFGVFFNTSKNSLFSDALVRSAMAQAVNKDELAQKMSALTKQKVAVVHSPVLPDFYGYNPPSKPVSFDPGQSKSLLDKAGYKETSGGVREKANPKKPAFQFSGYLKTGSRGNEVSQLQSCLARLNENFKTLLANEKDGVYGKGTESAVDAFQRAYLPDAKPTGETGAATRAKLNQTCLSSPNSQELRFTITTADQPQLMETAKILQKYWEAIGARVDIKAVSLAELKPIIKTRAYDALLYGEALGAQPDLYPFWHSSQKIDPGLNLSYYENKEADKLLRDARQGNSKRENYQKLQDIILKDTPAIFLYNPNYIYWVSQNVRGISASKIVDPAKRFANVEQWFIKTKRTWKQ